MTAGLDIEYANRFMTALVPAAAALEKQLRDYFSDSVRIDRISARPKSVPRFLQKAGALNGAGSPKYLDPLNEIQDQIGARIVTFYLSDVLRITQIIDKYFRHIEKKDVVPDSQSKFGYFGTHYILILPKGLVRGVAKDLLPTVFELQIKTLFQHAWSEANHDLGYKPADQPLSAEQERLLAFASAQAWGADHVFDGLFSGAKELSMLASARKREG